MQLCPSTIVYYGEVLLWHQYRNLHRAQILIQPDAWEDISAIWLPVYMFEGSKHEWWLVSKLKHIYWPGWAHAQPVWLVSHPWNHIYSSVWVCMAGTQFSPWLKVFNFGNPLIHQSITNELSNCFSWDWKIMSCHELALIEWSEMNVLLSTNIIVEWIHDKCLLNDDVVVILIM